MTHDEFIGQVRQRARLASRGAAERATRATLETLGDRLAGGVGDNLAAQLPPALGDHLRRAGEEGERLDLESFFDRVASREGVQVPEAVFHARCVIEVLDEATQGSALNRIHDQLPEEYERLFAAGSRGTMPPR